MSRRLRKTSGKRGVRWRGARWAFNPRRQELHNPGEMFIAWKKHPSTPEELAKERESVGPIFGMSKSLLEILRSTLVMLSLSDHISSRLNAHATLIVTDPSIG